MGNQAQNVFFGADSKGLYERLCSPISRTGLRFNLGSSSNGFEICLVSTGLYYINAYGHEIHPAPTPEYISALGTHQVLVYSCGSLWTRFAFVYAFYAVFISGMGIASFPASRYPEWPQQSHVLALCAQKLFSVSSHHCTHCTLSQPSIARSPEDQLTD